MHNRIGIPFIIAAPSGAGKTSLVNALVTKSPELKISISYTTRDKRTSEQDNVNYHYVQKDEFKALIQEGELLEYAEVFGHYYGTPKSWVLQQLEQGTDVILEIDWQGAQQLRERLPNAVSIFILPPSFEVLQQRLTERAQDDLDVIRSRMLQAKNEISHHQEFDYLVVNDNFEQALIELQHIVASEHLRYKHHSKELEGLLTDLLG